MAFNNVNLGDEHNIWWRYLANSGCDVVGCTFAAASCAHPACSRWLSTSSRGFVGVLVGFVVVSLTGTIHKPVLVHLLPVSTILPLYLTMQPILLKVTSQPALHSLTTDSRECDAKPGMMWPSRAFVGNLGRSRLHVCIEVTCPPSGSCTFNGVCAISL